MRTSARQQNAEYQKARNQKNRISEKWESGNPGIRKICKAENLKNEHCEHQHIRKNAERQKVRNQKTESMNNRKHEIRKICKPESQQNEHCEHQRIRKMQNIRKPEIRKHNIRKNDNSENLEFGISAKRKT